LYDEQKFFEVERRRTFAKPQTLTHGNNLVIVNNSERVESIASIESYDVCEVLAIVVTSIVSLSAALRFGGDDALLKPQKAGVEEKQVSDEMAA
jgi:hypothetical protein